MALSTANSALLAPVSVDQLLVQPVYAQSVALAVSRVINCDSNTMRIPSLTTDIGNAAVTAENAEITPDQPVVSELVISFAKFASLNICSRELVEDSNEDAAALVGESMARSIARAIDSAWLTVTAGASPSLASLTTGTVTSGAAFANTDPFEQARNQAEVQGAILTAFVCSPAVALELALIKRLTGSNEQLFAPDPLQPARRTVCGLPLLVTTYCQAKTVWGIPQMRCPIAVRSDARIDVDASAKFTADSVAIRSTMRVGWQWPQPLAIQKITHT